MPAHLSAGIAEIDEALGGLPAGSLVHVHGPPAAGKTSLAIQLARAHRPSALVLPEQPHPHRLHALLGQEPGRVLVARPEDLDGQDAAIQRATSLLRQGRIRALALDSLTYLYRFERLAETRALRIILRQLHRMRQAARRGGGLAVFTNQVRGSGQGVRPLGGPAVEHVADVTLSLEVLDGPWRRIRLTKHPAAP
ncbi:MAG: hypothetical protein R3185_09465, partial [Candidatus Thermoplasmatota archaeon]|nr:hypothetical protein [Candidatus Thermoplasmatota archaeon]